MDRQISLLSDAELDTVSGGGVGVVLEKTIQCPIGSLFITDGGIVSYRPPLSTRNLTGTEFVHDTAM
jgi:hypothetical protein